MRSNFPFSNVPVACKKTYPAALCISQCIQKRWSTSFRRMNSLGVWKYNWFLLRNHFSTLGTLYAVHKWPLLDCISFCTIVLLWDHWFYVHSTIQYNECQCTTVLLIEREKNRNTTAIHCGTLCTRLKIWIKCSYSYMYQYSYTLTMVCQTARWRVTISAKTKAIAFRTSVLLPNTRISWIWALLSLYKNMVPVPKNWILGKKPNLHSPTNIYN